MSNYRWNADQAARDFDQAAQYIHPYYLAIQDEILRLLQQRMPQDGLIVDLGGGSGRLMERLLESFPTAIGVIVDQSESFLSLAAERLAQFGNRAKLLQYRLQDDWADALPAPVDAFVSMSAIHHLDPQEKRALFAKCHASLKPGGVFLNGDEYRPEDDQEYLEEMHRWTEHKREQLQAGLIPDTFVEMMDRWRQRNITQFGRPKQSGDDCHETVEAQQDSLRQSGFNQVSLAWREELWGVLIAAKD